MSKQEATWADELLQNVRPLADPSAADAERNLAGIERRLGIGAAPGASEAPQGAEGSGAFLRIVPRITPPFAPPSGAAPAPLQLAAQRGLLLTTAAGPGRWLAFGLASAFVGYLVGRSESHPLPAVSPPPAPLVTEARPVAPQSESASEPLIATDPGPADLPQPQSPRSSVHAARVPARPSHALRPASAAQPTPAAAAHTLELREAIELLRSAEAALRRGEAFDASLLLSDLDRRAPAPLLREERLATETLVACALGERARAHAAANALERLNAKSIYRGRLEGSCAAPEKSASAESKTPPAPH